MKLYLVRNIGDCEDRYSVFDNKGNEKYTITGKYGLLGDVMRINDKQGNRLFKILQSSSALPITVYNLSGNGERIHLIFNNMRKSYSLMNISWYILGMAPQYEIIDADKTVIMRQTADPTGNGYMLEISCEQRELLCLAIAVCLNSISTIQQPKIAFQS